MLPELSSNITRSFSVIVPTLGRVKEVERLLRSLTTARAAYQGAVEIIIIDDSIPQDAREIRALSERSGATYVEGPGNVREKRNLGARLAKNEHIFFVDSDCWVSRDIFSAYDTAYASHPTAGGAAGPIEFAGPSSIVWSVILQTRLVEAAMAPRQQGEIPWAGCANLSFRRAALDHAGVFDTTLPFRLGGDDVDLCLRVRAQGLPLFAVPDAVVFHDRAMWNGWRAILRRAFRWGRVEYHLCQRHPRLRRLAFPRFWVVLILMLLVGALKALLTFDMRWLWLPAIWSGLSLSLFAVLDIVTERINPTQMVSRVLAAVPELTYQLGLCYEAIRRRDMTGALFGLFTAPEWTEQSWRPELFNTWANLISIFGAWIGTVWIR